MAMANRDLLQFHAQSLRDYAAFWFDPEARQESKVSEEEAAHHLCEHAAMLFRYTGQEVHFQGLTGQLMATPIWANDAAAMDSRTSENNNVRINRICIRFLWPSSLVCPVLLYACEFRGWKADSH